MSFTHGPDMVDIVIERATGGRIGCYGLAMIAILIIGIVFSLLFILMAQAS